MPYPLPMFLMGTDFETYNATDIVSFHALIVAGLANPSAVGLIFNETATLDGNTIIIDYYIDLAVWYAFFLANFGTSYTPCSDPWHIVEGSAGASVPFEISYALDCCVAYPPAPLVCLPELEYMSKYLGSVWNLVTFDTIIGIFNFNYGLTQSRNLFIRLKDNLPPGICCVANDAQVSIDTPPTGISFLNLPHTFNALPYEVTLLINHTANSTPIGTYDIPLWYFGCADPTMHEFKIRIVIS